jgi:hypothetical protein
MKLMESGDPHHQRSRAGVVAVLVKVAARTQSKRCSHSYRVISKEMVWWRALRAKVIIDVRSGLVEGTWSCQIAFLFAKDA